MKREDRATADLSERKPTAQAPPTRTAWKVMGTRCYHSPPVHPIPTLVFLLLLGIIIRAAEGFVQNQACNVDVCWDHYQMARDKLGLPQMGPGGTGPINNDSHCTALRTYWNCIQDIKNKSHGCQGNIRYYSIRNGVKNQMRQYNCSAGGRTVGLNNGPPPDPPKPPMCSYKGKKVFRQCGLFGDPHLRTFGDELQTCKVKGAWPLVNNEFLTVQVTNNPVTNESGATATSKLTVIVKKNTDCVSDTFQMYQAQTNDLPGTFYDGRTHYGKYRSLELIEVDPGKHVEIRINYIETTILVRQIGKYFTFAIRMPEEIVNSTRNSKELELCVNGCPVNERINYQEYLASRKNRIIKLSGKNNQMDRKEAEAICKESKVVDFYFDCCVFDLMTTGDKNFTLAAVNALHDVLRLNPSVVKTHQNRTNLKMYDHKYGNGAPPRTRTSEFYSWCVPLTVLLSVLFCSRNTPV